MRLNTVRFLVMLALVILTAPLRAETQHVGKVPRIGFIRAGPLPQDFLQGFQQGLRDHGYREGQNIIIEYRLTDGSTGALANLVAELLQGKVDVVVVSGTAAALAAKNATPTVPIVMAGVIDPVDSGLVGSLARPGGNITGMSLMSVDLMGKRVGLLKELVPQLSRFALLGHPAHPTYAAQKEAAEAGARALGVQLASIDVRDPKDFEAAFNTARKEQALIQMDGIFFTTHRALLTELAIGHGLPAIYGFQDWAEAGGLMSYGPNFAEVYRRAAAFVDKILKGTKPADLPVEQPMKFELIINLKTAKALGLTIPPTFLFQADKVIQ
jgi:putative ABC transport system substrate-binding protein